MKANTQITFKNLLSKLSEDNKGCLNWKRQLNNDGYGHYRIQGEKFLVHRLCWLVSKGPIPTNHCILHKCDNPQCVNINHLFLGTRTDNNRDRMIKSRSAVGEKSGRAKLTEYEVRQIRRLYNRKGETTTSLGRLFGVSNHQISMIVRRLSWSHIV